MRCSVSSSDLNSPLPGHSRCGIRRGIPVTETAEMVLWTQVLPGTSADSQGRAAAVALNGFSKFWSRLGVHLFL